MKFIKIGKHIFNLSQITRIELYEAGQIAAWFADGEKLNLSDPDSGALVAVLDAREIHMHTSVR